MNKLTITENGSFYTTIRRSFQNIWKEIQNEFVQKSSACFPGSFCHVGVITLHMV